MSWQTIQQFLRIALYTAGSFFLGDGIADGEMFQAAIGGIVSAASFLWWLLWERNRAPLTSDEAATMPASKLVK